MQRTVRSGCLHDQRCRSLHARYAESAAANGRQKDYIDRCAGAGESIERDKEYAALYKKLLPELDVVLWLIKADDRALASDETFFKNVVQPCLEKNREMVFFFVLNQCDKLEPIREWNVDEHKPSANQLENIERKREDVANHFNIAPSKVIAVSANEKYHLVELIDEIVYALPKDKKITLVKNAAEENVSERATVEAKNGFFDTIKEIVSDVAGVVVDKVGDAVGTVIDTLSNVGSAVGSFIGSIFSFLGW